MNAAQESPRSKTSGTGDCPEQPLDTLDAMNFWQSKRLFYLGILIIGVFTATAATAMATKKATPINVKNKKGPLYTYQGETFSAVALPGNISGKATQFQGQISKCLGAQFSPSPAGDLHITLQLIGPVSTAGHAKKIHKVLASSANNNKRWNLAKPTSRFKLRLHSNGLVTVGLPRSDKLSKLARSNRNNLKKSSIAHSKRFDFPDNAHITLGHVTSPNMAIAQKKLGQCRAQNSVDVRVMRARKFNVDRFVLLKSNRPAKKRHYAKLATYFLR